MSAQDSQSRGKLLSRDAHVEVVADQTADGAYEIRLQRSGEVTPASLPAADASGARVALGSSPAEAPPSMRGVWIGAGAAALAVAVIVVLLAVRSGGDEPPAVPVIAPPPPVEGFQSYVLPRDALQPVLARPTRLRTAGGSGDGVGSGDSPGQAAPVEPQIGPAIPVLPAVEPEAPAPDQERTRVQDLDRGTVNRLRALTVQPVQSATGVLELDESEEEEEEEPIGEEDEAFDEEGDENEEEGELLEEDDEALDEEGEEDEESEEP